MIASENYREVDFESRVINSSPLELLIFCYERVIDELHLLKSALAEPQSSLVDARFSKVREMIQRGLLDTLDFNASPEITNNLKSTYEWSLRQILLARSLDEIERLDAVIDAYRVLLSAWQEIKLRNDPMPPRS